MVKLPYLKKNIQESSVAIVGTANSVRFLREDVRNISTLQFIPDSANIHFNGLALTTILFAGQVHVDRLTQISSYYKLQHIPMIKQLNSVAEKLGLNKQGHFLKGDISPTDVKDYLAEEYKKTCLNKNIADAATAAMMYEFTHTPIPLMPDKSYILKFAEENGLSNSIETLNYGNFMRTYGMLSQTSKIQVHSIQNQTLISGPQLKDYELAKKIMTKEGMKDILNEIHENPGLDVTSQMMACRELRAAGAIETIDDPTYRKCYATPIDTVSKIISPHFGKNKEPELQEFLGEGMLITLGRMRFLKKSKLPKELSSVPQEDAAIVAPLLERGQPIYDPSTHHITEYGKEIAKEIEGMLSSIQKENLAYLLSYRKAQRVRQETVVAKYKQYKKNGDVTY